MKTFQELVDQEVADKKLLEPKFKCINCKKPSEQVYYRGFCSEECENEYLNEWEKVLESNS